MDAGSSRDSGDPDLPNVLDALLGAFDVLQSVALAARMEAGRPDIHVRPQVGTIRSLDFGKAEEVFDQAQPAIEDLRDQLERMGLTPNAGS